MSKPIFREKSLKNISSPDEFNQYIRIAAPRTWLILCFILIMLTAVIVWLFLGKLPTTITSMGYAESGQVVCYLSPTQADELTENVSVLIDGIEGCLISVSEMPLSQKEVSQKYNSDYITDRLAVADWNVEVQLSSKNMEDGLHEVSLTTETVQPISFLLN
ncbi:hypothetical protein Ami103574_08310 [Aminipila butyrica]|uniref:NHLM bacteriocin system secretion protein n=1 Tax=Aminipila butyrica TaxID=433296 RepID=A0A858BZ27_9FIRM|nr:hypothetical protein [Aminipila butyrica]QIB69326.1 hypothetical protein Ami103574_08310 [Aminipila butyrica]